MFADPYAAPYDQAAGGTVSFPLTALTGSSSVRDRGAITSNGYPKVIRMSHSFVGTGNNRRGRHLLRVETPQVLDGVQTALSGALYVVADFPVVGFDATAREKLLRQVVGILRGGSGAGVDDPIVANFLEKWVAGES